MGERITFTEKLSQYRDALLGRRALNSLNYGSPLVDEELKISYRGAVNDPTAENDLINSWRYIDSSQLQDAQEERWDFYEQHDENRYAMHRTFPVSIVVDEYGIETGYDPSRAQIRKLTDITGDNESLLEMLAGYYHCDLAVEGKRAINNPEFADEREIKKIFNKHDRELPNYASRIYSDVSTIAYPYYDTGEDAPEVGFYSKEEYLELQKVINEIAASSARNEGS